MTQNNYEVQKEHIKVGILVDDRTRIRGHVDITLDANNYTSISNLEKEYCQ